MKYCLLFIFALFTTAAIAQQDTVPNIKVRVEGIGAGEAYLIGIYTDQQFKLDSAEVDAGGNMTFTRPARYTQGLAFVLLPDQTFAQVLLTDDQRFEMSTKKGKLVEEMVVTGSADNEIFYAVQKYEQNFNAQYDKLDAQVKKGPLDPNYQTAKAQIEQMAKDKKKYLEDVFAKHPKSFFTTFKKAGQNPELKDFYTPTGKFDTAMQVYTYRNEFWSNVDFSDPRLMYTPVIYNKLNRYMTQLTPQNADSVISAASALVNKVLKYPEYFKYFANWITLKYEPTKSPVMDADAIYAYMIKNYFTDERAFWSNTYELAHLQRKADEMSQSLLRMKGPNVTAADPNGVMHSIYDLKAPYVVVFMFSPECSHCQEESPLLVKFANEWKNKGVDFFTIAVDTKDDEWRQFLTKHGMTGLINVYDPTNKAIYKKYYVDNTPEIYILNPDRTIIAKNIKVEQIAEVIENDKKGIRY